MLCYAINSLNSKRYIIMKDTKQNNLIERLALRYGVLMTLALVGFFLLMKAFGLEHNLELRALNIVILFSFVLMAIKHYKKKYRGQNLVYFKGFGLGVLTSAVGVVLFAVLVTLYVTVISPEFMEVIREREPFGDFLNPALIAFTITIEGITSGFLASYALMQYYRPHHVDSPVEEVV